MYVPGLLRGVRPMGDWSMAISLSRWSIPSIARCVPGFPSPLFKSRCSASTRISLTSELLPLPETPVIQTKRAERNLDIDVLEIVMRRAENLQTLLAGRSPRGRNLDLAFAGEKLAGDAPARLDDVARADLARRARRRGRRDRGRSR